MGKLSFVVGAGLGYVLGARAGRGRYEALRRAVGGVVRNRPAERQDHERQDHERPDQERAGRPRHLRPEVPDATTAPGSRPSAHPGPAMGSATGAAGGDGQPGDPGRTTPAEPFPPVS
ncbi:hypothetical protein MF406_06360 [Georgenia sp. TF02-10]|uniref:hypothetical protein n=1 Tax=Georgenia sp. TF02-10 TaxID=2917725 RepID=UPI001FA6D08C|nr:hypothetical protein [Georgenia sp. TF02-10]UNX55853.1 hypothetical protein MF406_06360 [Georgenia sp. TF02-10]